ncbi:MAG: hypothetical protein AB7E53_04480 [Macellibacteroides sp.]|uniref:hypothetical protein n=1 Tax=Macellibacteroides sp. TaxID=2014584 RepID=UPI003E7B8258
MSKNFDIEVRETPDKKYLKVFLKNTSIIEEVQELLSELDSVKNANITESQSKNNPPLTLTVYPNRVYGIEEMQKEVVEFLESYFNGTPQLTQKPAIIETQEWLANYPAAQKIFNEAIEKYKQKIYQRNVLDDMRLSLETFLREILGNQKSLENQLAEIGKYQKDKGLSPEFINMFNRLLDYYSKYQNNYVKHNDAVKHSEIDFVIHLTTLFMRCFM